MLSPMYRRVVLGALTLVTVGSVSTVAVASSVDFRTASGSYSSAASWSTDVDGVTVTISVGPTGSSLYWDNKDGFGVKGTNGYDLDEVEGVEYFTISFSDEILLGDLYLTDLFNETSKSAPLNAINPPSQYNYLEQGTYQLADGTSGTFVASPTALPDPKTNGEKTVAVNAETTSVKLTSPGNQGAKSYTYSTGTKTVWTSWGPRQVATTATGTYYAEGHEYSLAGLTFSKASASVPELDGKSAYGALGLLLGGLLTGTSRRRRAAAKSA